MLEDTELTRLVRDGDERAVEELYRRHYRAVLSYAARLSHDPQTAEDLASEAFARTLQTVRSGRGGPSKGWRPYLYAVVRNTASAWARSDRRLVLTPEFADLPAEPETEPGTATELVIRAYESLPERLKIVLWHTLIENDPPELIADILGTTRNNVNVLAFRAREALRRAYLKLHLMAVTAPECHAFADRIAITVRKPRTGLPRALKKHLGSCPDCSRAYADLLDLNTTLRAAIPFAVLLPIATKGGAIGVWSTSGAAAMHATAKSAAGKGLSVKGIGGIAAGSLTVAAAVAVGIAVWHGPDPRQARPPSPPPPSATSRLAPTAPPLASKTLTPAPVAGTRIKAARIGACVGVKANAAVALPCDDPKTAWKRDGGGRFRLMNKLSGRCLTAGEHYNTNRFNGRGVWAVRTAPCATAGTWSIPASSDKITRLANDETGGSMGIGNMKPGTHDRTTFVLYPAYLNDEEQRFTLG